MKYTEMFSVVFLFYILLLDRLGDMETIDVVHFAMLRKLAPFCELLLFFTAYLQLMHSNQNTEDQNQDIVETLERIETRLNAEVVES
jgi:hypothetical protein